MVAPLVAEIHLAVLDDRVIPIGDVESSIWTHFHINGSECPVG